MGKSLVLIIILMASGAAVAQTYDAASDFSPVLNPNGVWSFGWETTLGGAFNLDSLSGSFSGSLATIDMWNDPVSPFMGALHNSTGFTEDIGTVRYGANQLILHPGINGEYSIGRFTALTAGLYSVDALFTGQDFYGGTTTDVHVLRNNLSLFDGNVNGFLNATGWNGLVALNAGDTLDVAVGFGANGDYLYDSTGVSFRVSNTPEPFSMSLGVAGVGMYLRRRLRAKRA